MADLEESFIFAQQNLLKLFGIFRIKMHYSQRLVTFLPSHTSVMHLAFTPFLYERHVIRMLVNTYMIACANLPINILSVT